MEGLVATLTDLFRTYGYLAVFFGVMLGNAYCHRKKGRFGAHHLPGRHCGGRFAAAMGGKAPGSPPMKSGRGGPMTPLARSITSITSLGAFGA